MSAESDKAESSEVGTDKAGRIARLMNDVFTARSSGKLVDYESIMQNNADLMPDLADALKGFERIKSARAVAEAAPTITPEIERLAAAVREEFERPLIQAPGYSIEGELARGGQSIIYLATQLSTGRRVVVKVLRDGPLADERALARFKREAQILAALNHPNIVTVLDAGRTTEGSRFIVMDYIGGRTLDEFMQDRQRTHPADPSKLLRLFLKICAAVSAAHLRGVVHRDLKPSNIRIDDRGEPHILDFGLARTALDRFNESISQPVSITGEFLGSLPWSSPEQAEGDSEKIDLRTDVYSLGVMLYQMLTGGRFPYAVVGNIRDVLNNILTAEPTPPSKVVLASDAVSEDDPRQRKIRASLINETMERIVLKTLSKHPDNRYQSASELGRAVADYLAGRTPNHVAPTDSSPDPGDKKQAMPDSAGANNGRRLSRQLPVAAAAVLLLAAIGVILAVSLSRGSHAADMQTSVATTNPATPAATSPTHELLAKPIVSAASFAARKVDLMPLADVSRTPNHWQVRGNTFVGKADVAARLWTPYQPPAEYDYHVRLVRKNGREGMNIYCTGGGKAFHFNVIFTADAVTECRFQRIPNSEHEIVSKAPIPNQQLDIVLKIRKDGVEAVVNGKSLIKHPTDFTGVISDQPPLASGQKTLGIAVFKVGDGELEVQALDVLELSGPGNIIQLH
jgi:serine/threonine protein kinase